MKRDEVMGVGYLGYGAQPSVPPESMGWEGGGGWVNGMI
jgi:hypothetical protein